MTTLDEQTLKRLRECMRAGLNLLIPGGIKAQKWKQQQKNPGTNKQENLRQYPIGVVERDCAWDMHLAASAATSNVPCAVPLDDSDGILPQIFLLVRAGVLLLLLPLLHFDSAWDLQIQSSSHALAQSLQRLLVQCRHGC